MSAGMRKVWLVLERGLYGSVPQWHVIFDKNQLDDLLARFAGDEDNYLTVFRGEVEQDPDVAEDVHDGELVGTVSTPIYELDSFTLSELYHDAAMAIVQQLRMKLWVDEDTLKIKVGEGSWSMPLPLGRVVS